MDFVLTEHAKKRLKERGISEKVVKEAIQNPTKIQRDSKNRNRTLFKKVYTNKNKKRLFLIIGEIEKEKLKIITVIDTSKVEKYL